MYLPNFTYTNKTIRNMAEIDLIRGMILNAEITPELDLHLRKSALLRSALASTSLDKSLKVGKVKKSSKASSKKSFKFKPSSKAREDQDIQGYLEVLQDLDSYHEHGKVTEKLLFRMHEKLTENTLKDVHPNNKYREVDVELEYNGSNPFKYMPPNHELVPNLMEELLKWVNNNSTEISPITVAGTAHWKMLRIQPFCQGNGQTARALTDLILYLRLFNTKGYFSLEEYYKKDEKAYLNALSLDLEEKKSLTMWMEYFTDGVLTSLSETGNKISNLTKTGKCFDRSTFKDYTKILSFLHIYGKITPKDVATLFGINESEAVLYLQKLEELSVIKKKKRHGSSYYILKIRADQLKKQWKILFKKD
jgi:Fic family protein